MNETKTYKTQAAAKTAITKQQLENVEVVQQGELFVIEETTQDTQAPTPEIITTTAQESQQLQQEIITPVLQFKDEQEMRDWLAFKDQQKAKQDAIVQKKLLKDKCHRHPEITVKPGENCPKCLKNIAVDEQRKRNIHFLPPCPQCGNSEHQSIGGSIARARKAGSFICGNCQITYNMKAESAQWGKGDHNHH